jgi:uncharacterized protein YecT (DUF1311 family)
MPTDPGDAQGSAEFAPNLSKLENEYQILTELYRSADSRTYLARHLELNRDVTVTVVRAPAGSVAGESALRHFASDARALTSMRHANIIPVIEGRWLDDGAFAIVRARVRGSSLEQVLDAAGPMSAARTASALTQVNGALEWARSNGIAHRYVAAASLIFQQGSGRVLLSLDPPPVAANALPNACDDARTIGRLGTEMLTGMYAVGAGRRALSVARPDLPPAAIDGVDLLVQCDVNAPTPDVAAVLRTLDNVGERVAPADSAVTPASSASLTPGAPSVALPLAAAAAAVVTPRGVTPAGPTPAGVTEETDGNAVVLVNRGGMGFSARLATAVVVIALLIVAGVLVLHRRGGSGQSASNAGNVTDTSTQSGGDIALRSQRPDTAVIDPTAVAPTIVSPPAPVTTPAPTTVAPPATYPPTSSARVDSVRDSLRAVMDSMAAARVAVPVGRRHEPERPLVPPLRMPPPGTIDTTTATSSSTPPSASSTNGDICASPVDADQLSCAAAAMARSDRDVSAAFDRVVGALRRQVNAGPNDPDPASVSRLRAAQEGWRNDREAFCRDAGVAPLFGRDRGRCYSERAAARTRELQQLLDTLPQRDSTTLTSR